MDSLFTQDTFAGKIFAVFARHTDDMSDFMLENGGFSSRFRVPEETMFDHIAPAKCVVILLRAT